MNGTVEWAVLSFIVLLLLIAIRYTYSIVSISNDLEKRISLLEKDVRHLKENIKQYAVIYADMHDDVLLLKQKKIGKK